jgi:DNA-binding transcriptional ArsR family regulator
VLPAIQAAASQHLKLPREAGLTSVRLEGNRRFYQALVERLAELRAMLDDLWGTRLAELTRTQAEGRQRERGRS